MSNRIKRFCMPLALTLAISALCACQAGRIHPERPLSRLPQIEQRLDRAVQGLNGESRLMVGASKVDISPYGFRVWIAGFGPGRISRGMLDPIWARALYIDDGSQALVLLTLDVVGLGLMDVQRIRELAAPLHGDKIMVIATHNHQGPDTVGLWGPGVVLPLDSGVEPQYHQRMLTLAAVAVDRAVRDAVPATLHFGSADVPAGWAANLWFPDDESTFDHQLSAIRAVDAQGNTIATLFNWAMHAEALFQKNHRVSADFPGRAYDAIEQRSGGVAMFVSNAAGGMVIPYPNRWDKRGDYDLDDRVQWIDELGQVLADTVDRALDNSQPFGPGAIIIKHNSRDIFLPVDNAMYNMMYRNGLLSLEGRPTKVEEGQELIGSEVHAVSLGPAQIALVPGELFPSIGWELKAAMDAPYRFVFTLANDELGYMMLPAQFEDRTYKYERGASLGPQTGAIVLQAAKELLAQLP
ncbi:MAG: neutral/alkaline non-lysosomal ceramidase N-terminal domain-containing protein [Candidatus Alcyoniella australis]|nr:neutral/alkaline non-lysosomal ceramidase N-terminal domain-containing protein [Candidatus Alcyoniella australis]